MSIKTMLDHRTIREFTKDEVPKEVLETLKQVVNRSPSWTGLQAYSIIRVKDDKLREEIFKISTQEYLKTVPELWIFVVDINRNLKIMEEKIKEVKGLDMDRFFQGFTDAIIAASQLTVAAEELGLGTVYFGSALNDLEKLIELLKLPRGTFPAIAVGFGYKNQKPQLKPRMDIELKFFENTYEKKENYLELIKKYDEEMTNYYDTRDQGRRSDSFSNQVSTKYSSRIFDRDKILNVVKKQGFELKIEK